MASSRQRLINASSFLSDQKEKIGGLNVKKSTISGDAFKKGTPLEKRVGVNEKKITLLKNLLMKFCELLLVSGISCSLFLL